MGDCYDRYRVRMEEFRQSNIIIRQCGTKWRPGRNVGLGSDYTIFALVAGEVMFDQEGRLGLGCREAHESPALGVSGKRSRHIS